MVWLEFRVEVSVSVWCSCFVPSLQTIHTLLAGLRGVVTFGSSTRAGGSPLAARALATNSDTYRRGPAGGYAVYLECLVWPRLSQAPEPLGLAVSHHRSLGHNIVHNSGTLVITRKLRVLHVVSAGNCQSPCPGRLKHRKAGCASQVGPLCAARRRWFLGAAMAMVEEYPLSWNALASFPLAWV